MQSFDYLILLLYFCLLLVIGYFANKKQKNTDDYYVGGRNVGTLSLGALWMSSWVGGACILGTAEKSYEMGISSLWYSIAMFIGFIVFSLTFAGRVKEMGDKFRHITYPDLIEERYDTRSRLVSTVTTIVAYIGYTATQLLAAAHIITTITNISLGYSFVIATVITISYTSFGGFFAVEKTDRFQALLVLLGISLFAVPLTWNKVGGLSQLTTNLSPTFFELDTWGVSTIFAMITSIILTFFTSMDSYTRCYAAKSKKSARNGTLIAGFAVLCIAFSVCFLGMSARLLFPDQPGGEAALVQLIITVFPIGIKGLMLVAILSAIMSTADACILSASANITRDIYQRFINPEADSQKVLRLGIFSSVMVGTTGALIAWYSESIISLLVMTFTINSAGLFFPTIGAFFWKRANSQAAFWSMTISLAIVCVWYLGQYLHFNSTVFNIDPLWPGLIVSFTVFSLMSALSTDSSTEMDLTKGILNVSDNR
ncbi:sodium:solute symporter family protein [Desulfosediminicola ganghwensis]|uniref:sodium:solute symporter family protein n=1 Tax=Desulfosediminicola ganghwensis TaxID=2569540 RepID=UPI0010AD21F7|nr:sodium:solute symporter family protein [Desulfosediminicola ganghwensis]